MSRAATDWAWSVSPGSAPLKLILLAMADRADEEHCCYPSIKRLEADTCLNRKTIQSGIKQLEKLGLVVDTGEKKGPTQRVRVFRLALTEPSQKRNDPKNGNIPKSGNNPKNGNVPENGTLNDPKNGMLNDPEFGTLNDPKNGTQNQSFEPVTEPVTEPDCSQASAEPRPAPQLVTTPRVEIPADMPGPKDQACKTFRAWANYAFAYRKRYGAWPVWNAKAGGQIGQLIDRLGADAAPQVAAFYVGINDARLINDCHTLGALLAKAEAIHTQWATGRQMNGRTARQLEDTQANLNAAQEASARILSKEGKRNAFL